MAFFIIAVSRPAYAVPARYVIDPDHTSIYFMVDHLGFAKAIGRFNKFKGSFVFDEENMTLSDVKVVIYPESIDTGHYERDQQLKGPRYFDIGQYPEMVFTAVKTIKTLDSKGVISGKLRLLGHVRPVNFDVTWNKSGPSPLPGDNSYRIGTSLRGRINRHLFGMTADMGFVGRNVDIIIEMEAVRQ